MTATRTPLNQPWVFVEDEHSRRLEHTPGRAYVDPRLREKGLVGHTLRLERREADASSSDAVPLVIAWPTANPGYVALDLFEVPHGLRVENGVWTSSGAEVGDTESPLVRLRLAVEPGDTDVRFEPEVEALYDPGQEGRFEGAVFDVDLTIEDGKGKARARFTVRGVPMVERIGPSERELLRALADEGSEWELEARLHYVPATIKVDTPLLDQYREATFRGAPDWRTFVPLRDRNRYLQFGVSRDPSKPTFTLSDRLVLGVHVITGWHGKLRRDRCVATLALQLSGKVALWTEGHVQVKPTQKRSAGLLRKELTWKVGDQTLYVEDVTVELPRRQTVSVEDAGRLMAARSTYFLVPDELVKPGATIKLSRLLAAPRKRLTGPAPLPSAPSVDHVEFAAKGWEAYSSVLKTILQKLVLIQAWQGQQARLREGWKGELLSYEQVVSPILTALEGVRFKTRNVNWGGRSDTKLAALHVASAHRATWNKVKLLRRIDAQIARHAAEALQLFDDGAFRAVFYAQKAGKDPFLGQGFQVGWSVTRDRLRKVSVKAPKDPDALERARGGDSSEEAVELTIPPATFVYDSNLKLQLCELVSCYAPLTAASPGELADSDPKAVVAAQRKRIELYRRAVQPGMAAVYEALADDTQKKQVDWLLDDADRAHLWRAGMFGAPAALMYGDEYLGGKLAHFYMGPEVPGATRQDFFVFTDQQLEQAGQSLMRRAGKYVVDQEFMFESSLATVKFMVDSYRFWRAKKGWNAETILDAADLLVASSELVLRTAALSGKLGPRLVTAGGAHYFKVVGKIGPWIDVLKEVHTLYEQLDGLMRGKPTNRAEVLFTITNLYGLILIAMGLPGIGGVVVAVVIAARSLYDAFRIIELEEVPAWYARTPWGHDAQYDYEARSGALRPSDPKAMFVAACTALSLFFSHVWEHLSKEQRVAVRDYFTQWAAVVGKSLGVVVLYKEDEDFFKLIVS